MKRVLRLRDVLRIHQLNRLGAVLDVERALTEGYTPMRMALRSWVDDGTRTYLLFHIPGGWHLLQLARRGERPEWDLVYMSPAEASFLQNITPWQDLLSRILREALHRGVYRLYVSPPADSPFQRVFQELGFRPYTRERVYTWQSDAPGETGIPSPRPRTPELRWHFSRLWQQVTPSLVIAAETLNANGLMIPYAWADRAGQRVFVQLDDGDVVGAVALRKGKRGCWARLLLAPGAKETGQELVEWLVGQKGTCARRPLFVAVREYQGTEQEVLRERGFRLYDTRVHMVRHLALPLSADERVSEGLLALAGLGGEPVYSRSWEGEPVTARSTQTFSSPPT